MTPTFRRTPAERLVAPLERFLHTQASGGILLLLCTIIALVWANSSFGGSYVELWKKTEVGFTLGGFEISHPLYWWVNDGLMAIFFFVVGLEIKREILIGELSSRRQAILPVAAAFGGMIVPAVLYAIFNREGMASSGWGIPMATDIAFAIGILSLLGKRVPVALKVFLTALAIADDLGAVLVIAFFYTTAVSLQGLAIAGAALIGMIALNRLEVRNILPYLLGGIVLWFGFVISGIHPTVGGVLAALTIPASQRIDIDKFLEVSKRALGRFEADQTRGSDDLPSRVQRDALGELDLATDYVEMPMRRLEDTLHPWVSYLIMPLFALANAGVAIDAGLGKVVTSPVALGVVLGLVVGKPVGIFLFSWVAVKLGVAELPRGVQWRAILGAGSLAGIGFTMSIFIAGLAFGGDDSLLKTSKLAILAASLISGILGSIALVSATRAPDPAAASSHA
ncbi:MAG: Na+/H+ antiporter NhaA [Candidatus Eisenbacteria bacterium]|uniref:Na(+)/H(+) antiporter NhaA n=1 Tax=Eiseniibacteriota bacterium TaxID=2212470 RepID=A0A956NFY9_UNCEI|nr:Na+/H+ antiporter NhaA [Candidatus Eisenbacteria bacterium]